VEGPNTARPVATIGCPAPGSSWSLRTALPYREHALISQQEHEAWEMLLAREGQLRLAPRGLVIGIDMDAALSRALISASDVA
jgi:hypothetical protein